MVVRIVGPLSLIYQMKLDLMCCVYDKTMHKMLLKSVNDIITSKYLFINNERDMWEGIYDSYRYKSELECSIFSIVDMLREMRDPHLFFSINRSVKDSNHLFWKNNILYARKTRGDDNRVFIVDSIMGKKTPDVIATYSRRFKCHTNLSEAMLLNDIINGRYRNNGENQYLLVPTHHFFNTGNNNHGISKTRSYNELLTKVQYYKINDFYTANNMDAFSFKNDDVNAIVIDVRNNCGGWIDEALKTTGTLLNDEVQIEDYYVYDGDKKYRQIVKPISDNNHIAGKKVFILMNEYTMSSAEYIFVLAIKKAFKGITIGKKTMGMRGQCMQYALGDIGRISVTTKKYLLEDGEYIDRLIPDVEVLDTIDDMLGGCDASINTVMHMIDG